MHSNRLSINYLSSFKCYFFTYFYYYYLSQNPIHFNILSTNKHQPKLYCIFINNTHKTQIFSSITPIKPRFLSSTTSTFHNLLLNHFNYFTHFIHLRERERERERERDAVKEKVGKDPPCLDWHLLRSFWLQWFVFLVIHNPIAFVLHYFVPM